VNKAKQLVRWAIDSGMMKHGWRCEIISQLPPAYLRDQVVTPFFSCLDIARRPFGDYLIEGVIGIIHRDFENQWLNDASRQPPEQGFGVVLHTANLIEIGEKLYIPTETPQGAEVDQFCGAISGLLEQMPQDEPQLSAAFAQNEVCGRSLDKFSGYYYRRKFEAFRKFVEGLPLTHEGG
jgi:hypothetical protein